jgi:hypothetical protein
MLREKHGLKYENRRLRGKFGPKGYKVTGGGTAF